jgi:hypothetical protein
MPKVIVHDSHGFYLDVMSFRSLVRPILCKQTIDLPTDRCEFKRVEQTHELARDRAKHHKVFDAKNVKSPACMTTAPHLIGNLPY